MQRFVNDFFALILIMKYCKTIDNIYFTELQLSSLGFFLPFSSYCNVHDCVTLSHLGI